MWYFVDSNPRSKPFSAVRKRPSARLASKLSPQERLFLAGELIGERVLVEWSSDKGLAGLGGRVVDETAGTFVLDTPDGEKRVPKKGCAFFFPGAGMAVEGKILAMRPEERTKKLLERK